MPEALTARLLGGDTALSHSTTTQSQGKPVVPPTLISMLSPSSPLCPQPGSKKLPKTQLRAGSAENCPPGKPPLWSSAKPPLSGSPSSRLTKFLASHIKCFLSPAWSPRQGESLISSFCLAEAHRIPVTRSFLLTFHFSSYPLPRVRHLDQSYAQLCSVLLHFCL